MSTIFLMPGLRGDGDELEPFKSWLARRLSCTVIDHPSIAEPTVLLVDLQRIGAHAADEIERRQPAGPLLIAGYSFGGCVAWEAARHLLERGRDVRFLAVIDAPIRGTGLIDSHHTSSGPRIMARDMLRSVSRIDLLRRAARAIIRRFAPASAGALDWFMSGFLRRQAVDHWTPPPVAVATVVFVASESFATLTERPFRAACPNATFVSTDARHRSLLEPAALQRWGATFESALRQSL